MPVSDILRIYRVPLVAGVWKDVLIPCDDVRHGWFRCDTVDLAMRTNSADAATEDTLPRTVQFVIPPSPTLSQTYRNGRTGELISVLQRFERDLLLCSVKSDSDATLICTWVLK